jgi:predicted alpha/beta superfamily hydrolase
MLRKIPLFICWLIFIVTDYPVIGQSARITKKDSLYSNILEEQRLLNIVFPASYENKDNEPVDVVYCLDDVSEFQIAEMEFLQGEGFVPKNAILAGITNSTVNGEDMRLRDFSPTHLFGVTGGADKFLLFMKDELMPFIQEKYHAKSSGHTLFGGSLAGLMVVYTFLKQPALFTSYVAIDPSLWWDNRYILKQAEKELGKRLQYKNSLYVGGREGTPSKEMGIARFDTLLQQFRPTGLDCQVELMTNETHYSTNFTGFWKGLKLAYGGFYASTGGYIFSRKIIMKPVNGVAVPGKAFSLFCYNLNAHKYIHYTTDGTVPTELSPTLSGEHTNITLSESSPVILKSIGKRSEYDRADTAFFTVAAPWKAVLPLNAKLQSGMRYNYYSVNPAEYSISKKLKPIKSGIANDTFNVNHFDKHHDFVCDLQGFLRIEKEGYYTIEMGGINENTRVYLNDSLVLGRYFSKEEGDMYMLPLEAGMFKYRVIYGYQQGGPNLAPIYIKPERIDDFPITSNILYY